MAKWLVEETFQYEVYKIVDAEDSEQAYARARAEECEHQFQTEPFNTYSKTVCPVF